jgi:6-phosphofructokinase
MPRQLTFNPNDITIKNIIKKVKPFRELNPSELKTILEVLKKERYRNDEIVVKEGEPGSAVYIIASGKFQLLMMDRHITYLTPGDSFGEIALVDAHPRMGTIIAKETADLFRLERRVLDDPAIISTDISKKIYQGFARMISSYLRQGSTLYNTMDVLLIQDGGCAPGYNPVTAFITEQLSRMNRTTFIAAEGFKSIVSNRTSDYRCLVYDPEIYKQIEHIPGVIFSPPLREARGANFRSERFPEFKYLKQQKIAAQNIINRKVKVVIGIGGNGTFYGIQALSKLLPNDIKTYFVPVTVDSDISGSDCIGEYTGVEVGSEKIRSYMADARTHKRFYFIEMMGARGGFHALYSSLGAGAHLAVVPSSNLNLKSICRELEKRQDAVIVIAEGYKARVRKQKKYKGNAAEYFRDELLKAGLQVNQRIVCEGFARDIRGAAPNNLDIMLAQRMARKLAQLISQGKSRQMPAVLSGKEHAISFDKIDTDNSVTPAMASLGNRLTNK